MFFLNFLLVLEVKFVRGLSSQGLLKGNIFFATLPYCPTISKRGLFSKTIVFYQKFRNQFDLSTNNRYILSDHAIQDEEF